MLSSTADGEVVADAFRFVWDAPLAETTRMLTFSAMSNDARSTEIDTMKIEITSVPEPETWFLLGSGLAGLFLIKRRVFSQKG